MNIRGGLSAFFCAMLFSPILVSAQSGLGADLGIIVSPQNPRAGTTVTLTAENYSIDLNTSTLTWYVNGELKQQGKGVKSFNVKLGPLGSKTTIKLVAVTSQGITLQKELNFEPAEVDLMWQSNGYTPPFYKGKSLLPYDGTALVVALPKFQKDGRNIPASDLVFTWKENDTVIGESSGLGSNFFVTRIGVPIRTKNVSVSVTSEDGQMTASGEITLEPVSTRILLYENHPLYGIKFEKALNEDFGLLGDEATLTAIPYYAEAFKRNNPSLSYKWSLNSALLGSMGSDLTIRRPSEKGGRSFLGLEVENTDKPFQTAQNSLTIYFADLVRDLFGSENNIE